MDPNDLKHLATYIETALYCAKKDVEPYTKEIIRKLEINSTYGFANVLLGDMFTEDEWTILDSHRHKKQNRNTILQLKKMLKEVLEFEECNEN